MVGDDATGWTTREKFGENKAKWGLENSRTQMQAGESSVLELKEERVRHQREKICVDIPCFLPLFSTPTSLAKWLPRRCPKTSNMWVCVGRNKFHILIQCMTWLSLLVFRCSYWAYIHCLMQGKKKKRFLSCAFLPFVANGLGTWQMLCPDIKAKNISGGWSRKRLTP